MRLWLKAGGALALMAACAPAIAQDEPRDDAVPLPEALVDIPAPLAPFIVDGRYEPGDFGWMRGRFDSASEAEKADYAQVNAWLGKCYEAGNAASEARLAALGIGGFDARGDMGVATLCVAVSSQPQIEVFADFADFSAALQETRPIFDTLMQSIFLAERIGGARSPELGDLIEHRPLGEQMLRNAWSWVWTDGESVRPKLSARQKPIFDALLSMELARADAANTKWLREIVAEKGWPTRTMVGEDASRQAWLLAQHADQAPDFQLEVLRLMEPLVAQKEVSPRDYAYLYDRVMLKLSGKQRYATQMWCKDSIMEAQPLEDADKVDELRSEMTLEPFAEYRKHFPETC